MTIVKYIKVVLVTTNSLIFKIKVIFRIISPQFKKIILSLTQFWLPTLYVLFNWAVFIMNCGKKNIVTKTNH